MKRFLRHKMQTARDRAICASTAVCMLHALDTKSTRPALEYLRLVSDLWHEIGNVEFRNARPDLLKEVTA